VLVGGNKFNDWSSACYYGVGILTS